VQRTNKNKAQRVKLLANDVLMRQPQMLGKIVFPECVLDMQKLRFYTFKHVEIIDQLFFPMYTVSQN